MALTKTIEVPKIEVVNNWTIQVATDTVIKEDGAEISRTHHRKVLTPDMDVYGESKEVQDLANVLWTDEVKKAYEDSKKED